MTRHLGPIALIIAVLGLCLGLTLPGIGSECGARFAALASDQSRILEVPQWILHGIAAVESRSRYDGGRIIYVDRRDGSAGEVGAFQIQRCALLDIGLLSQRSAIRSDPAFCEYAAILYLRRLYRATGSWRRAVVAYHVGLDGDAAEGADYLRRVTAAGAWRL